MGQDREVLQVPGYAMQRLDGLDVGFVPVEVRLRKMVLIHDRDPREESLERLGSTLGDWLMQQTQWIGTEVRLDVNFA
ncbi:hypothetical protein WN48_04041 [Eufriesea mexicana]|uniref:Uncharacterized protein n=1 Tax=Eufriesea mexicana TaxID=516756 RepID=A0A310SNT9_9HYME|nr:hypothetical protein WN48_04041 [Eufriesea mexicana]